MTDLTPNKNQVALADRKPLAYMLVVLVLLLGTVTGMYFKSTATLRTDCLENVKDLRKEIAGLRGENKELRMIVVGIKNNYTELKTNTDSVIREAIHSNPNLKP